MLRFGRLPSQNPFTQTAVTRDKLAGSTCSAMLLVPELEDRCFSFTAPSPLFLEGADPWLLDDVGLGCET